MSYIFFIHSSYEPLAKILSYTVCCWRPLSHKRPVVCMSRRLMYINSGHGQGVWLWWPTKIVGCVFVREPFSSTHQTVGYYLKWYYDYNIISDHRKLHHRHACAFTINYYKLELSRACTPRARCILHVMYPALTCYIVRVCEYLDDLYRHNALDLCAWADSTWPAVDRRGQ